ncbi:hypothetical protein [uncultured Psychrosphaera sp.]|uniref:hypothetical protein n=1 Tax=uncultured Psychrosphaera sp. TaxID=1403522 RepID=UPI0026225545|nr:hypothetical protein [uncultured Psychrosphaera sp.]
MECPHCNKKVGLFSKALNKMGKVKLCPHCSGEIKLFVDFKVAAILLVPFVVLSLFVLKPLMIQLGLSGSIATGLATGIVIALSMRLKKGS